MMKSKIFNWLPDKTFLKIKYYYHFHKRLDLKNPKTFNEKLQWLKLYDRKDIYSKMVDKYESKNLVVEKVGDKYENNVVIGHNHAHSFEQVINSLYNFPESFNISKEDEQFYSKQELENLRRVKKYLLFIGLKDAVSFKNRVSRYRNAKQKKYEHAFIYKYTNKEISSILKGRDYIIYEYLDFYKENREYSKGEYQALIVDEEDNFRIFIEFTKESVQSYYSVKNVYQNSKLKDNDKVLIRYFKVLEKY